MVRQVIELTLVLVALYLVLTNASGFANVARSLGGVYTSSVKALQGR
jgi:hypothetical protein